MVSTYSPHRSGGGILHLPSPTHIHADRPSLRDLRRSLSRSPSKPNFILITSPLQSPTTPSPHSPSPLSPSRNSTYFANIINAPSPLAVPFPPSAKIRGGSRRGTPMRASSARTRSGTPATPGRKPLGSSQDSGNAPSPPSPSPSQMGREKAHLRSASPASSIRNETFNENNFQDFPAHTSAVDSPKRSGLDRARSTTSSASASPLKRSDGIMNLDRVGQETSTANKRRSIHGGIFDTDFDFSSMDPDEVNSDSDRGHQSSPRHNPRSGQLFPMPKRSSSLRKSTLQQRHGEKTTFGRMDGPASDVPFEFATPIAAASKSKHRISLDCFLPPMPRDSPFGAAAPLQNASVHPIQFGAQTQNQHNVHPLSRQISNSTSSGSVSMEDTISDVPVHAVDQSRHTIDFSKSLPMGAPRPFGWESNSQSTDESTFATPQNYKLVRPLPAAFMSTGLISKRNRNTDEEPRETGAGKAQMPDTPCKKPTMSFQPTIPIPGSVISKARNVRHSFGTPSTPFSAHQSRTAPGTFGKGVTIFGSGYGNLSRRASFASNEGDENGLSPSSKMANLASIDFELPPTPTKPASWGRQKSERRSLGIFGQIGDSNVPASAVGPKWQSGLDSKFLFPGGGLTRSSPISSLASISGDEDGAMEIEKSPSPLDHSISAHSLSTRSSSLARVSQLKTIHSLSPTPPTRRWHAATMSTLSSQRKLKLTKTLAPASAIPMISSSSHLTPHTPQEAIHPPDPSGLSISAHGDEKDVPASQNSSVGSLPPATPTTNRDYFPLAHGRRYSITPITSFVSPDVDSSLASRFSKVELIGTGEFSQVYRVNKPQPITSSSPYSSTSQFSSPTKAKPDPVFAVKKSRRPYTGPRDRKRKLREVTALQAMGHNDHIVQFMDHWEADDHLYIQTEFCEEGSLDLFLTHVGRKARLDDFRIWKVLLELSLVGPKQVLYEIQANMI
jgi:mitosis inhibitor protein kinase SWE1